MVNRPNPPPPQPPTPLPPDIGGLGARGGKIPAKNKEKWYGMQSMGLTNKYYDTEALLFSIEA
jgi:hypothetical protein